MLSTTLDPENRLVARGLEAEWEQRLRDLEKAQAELTRRETQRPKTLSEKERNAILAFGMDLKLGGMWVTRSSAFPVSTDTCA